MAEGKFTKETIELTPQQKKARRARNIAIAVVLVLFIVLMYAVTWAKLGINIYNRDL